MGIEEAGWFELTPLQTRLTRSRGRGAEASGIVVRTDFPLRLPCEPALRLNLSKVQRLPPSVSDL